MHLLIDWIIDHPKAVLAGALLLALGFAVHALRVEPDTSPEAFLPRGHISYHNKKLIDEIYGINDPILISVTDKQSSDIYNTDAMRVVKQVSDFVDNLEGIQKGSVRSLATREDIKGTSDGFDVRVFLEDIPSTRADLDNLRERVLAFPLWIGLLVSEDETAAGVIGDVEADADVLYVFHEVNRFVNEEIDQSRYEISLTGPPIVTGTLNVYLNRDALVLNPIAALVTCLLLFLSFRTVRGVALPFLVVVPAVAVALGTMGLAGLNFTPFSNAIPVVILATALADSIHILGTYYQKQAAHPALDRRTVVRDTVRELWEPIVVTSLTTGTGFISLVFTSPMQPVQDFGIAVAAGVVGAMVYSLTVLPAVLMMMPLKGAAVVEQRTQALVAAGAHPGFLQRQMQRLYGFVMGRTPVAMGIIGVLLLIGIVGLTRLRVDYNPVVFFPEDSAVYIDNQKISQRFVGTNFIELHLDSGREDGVFEPDFLQQIEQLQTDIESWAQVGGTIALTDYMKKMNQAFHEDRNEFYRLAGTSDTHAQYFFLYTLSGDPTQFDEVLDNNYRHINLRIFLKKGDDSHNRIFIDWLITRLETDFGADHHLIGGEAFVNYHWMRMIEKSVIWSVLLMSLSMFVIGWLLLKRSFLAALFLVLPVNMGILLTYAVMGYMDIPVGLGTSIFAAIAIGIGVDYAIHYIAHYQRSYGATLSYEQATFDTLTTTGVLLVTNSATVVCGFLVLIFAKTMPPQNIGIFVAVGVGTSLLVTLLLLSVLTRFLKPAATASKTGVLQ